MSAYYILSLALIRSDSILAGSSVYLARPYSTAVLHGMTGAARLAGRSPGISKQRGQTLATKYSLTREGRENSNYAFSILLASSIFEMMSMAVRVFPLTFFGQCSLYSKFVLSYHQNSFSREFISVPLDPPLLRRREPFPSTVACESRDSA